ncbi:MAG: GYD domain-containing protein [Nitrososphaeraceae archaeon]|nr:GYD domain-containing protein [Nitrososphaeraceae archaeon]
MPHYIILFNFTEQGLGNVKDTIKRAEAFKNAVEEKGDRFVNEYYTFGKYDIITIVEAPNDQAIASLLFATGSLGNVHTETLKAFSMSEAASIIERLS